MNNIVLTDETDSINPQKDRVKNWTVGDGNSVFVKRPSSLF